MEKEETAPGGLCFSRKVRLGLNQFRLEQRKKRIARDFAFLTL
jgi:hypothetical protein